MPSGNSLGALLGNAERTREHKELMSSVSGSSGLWPTVAKALDEKDALHHLVDKTDDDLISELVNELLESPVGDGVDAQQPTWRPPEVAHQTSWAPSPSQLVLENILPSSSSNQDRCHRMHRQTQA